MEGGGRKEIEGVDAHTEEEVDIQTEGGGKGDKDEDPKLPKDWRGSLKMVHGLENGCV